MYFKCIKCNKNNIFIFSWLSGQAMCSICNYQYYERKNKNLCVECGNDRNVWFSGRCDICNKLLLSKELYWQENSINKIEKIKLINNEVQPKYFVLNTVKNTVSIIFIALVYAWLIMWFMSSPTDFWGVVLGWTTIGIVYLIYKYFPTAY